MFFNNSTVDKILFEGEPGKHPEIRINADTVDEEDKEVYGGRQRRSR